jgi:beta-galactosidase
MSSAGKREPMFLWGTQYYRAPTPEPECWQADFKRMQAIGFRSVKFWVQWRWSHRRNDRFVFGDLDRLMDLAQAHGMKVHLNTIFDVSPHWLFEKYPDAAALMNNGRRIEPFASAHRQIGGLPGPCYCHPGALAERRKFLETTLAHFRDHPALEAWDVWNEPELNFAQRTPDMDTLACYCANCESRFKAWLKDKYGTLERLNQTWARCYEMWDEVEMPRDRLCLQDFVDWRLFHTDVMTAEAKWRLDMVRELDPQHTAFLHVVSNTLNCWSLTTCAMDEFALADLHDDVYAASTGPSPLQLFTGLSGGKGRLFWNTESHVNFGGTSKHPRKIGLNDLLLDWLPQIGAGIRGFMFWQFRAETRGWESPAWGLVRTDGSDKPVTSAAQRFWNVIEPITEDLLACPPKPAPIAIWKSGPNELFHFAMHGTNQPLIEALNGAIERIYRMHYPVRIVDNNMLTNGELDDVKVLVMPCCYYLTQGEADGLDRWVRAGGVLLCDAHLGGYDGTRGAHSRTMPGFGLDERWGIRETEYSSSYHLRLDSSDAPAELDVSDDVRKALATSGISGGKYFPIALADGTALWGAERYAELQALGGEVLGTFAGGLALVVRKQVDRGTVFYCGSNVTAGAHRGSEGFDQMIRQACDLAQIMPALGATTQGNADVRIDAIRDADDQPRYLVITNRDRNQQTVCFDAPGKLRGLFSGRILELRTPRRHDLPPQFSDIFEFLEQA